MVLSTEDYTAGFRASGIDDEISVDTQEKQPAHIQSINYLFIHDKHLFSFYFADKFNNN